MMQTPSPVPARDPNFLWTIKAQGSSSASVAPSQDEQGAPTPDSFGNETEPLLDLHGLLEIARLVEEIKKDGRFNSEGEGYPESASTRRRPQPKS